MDALGVVPHAGTWIEIPILAAVLYRNAVVPHAGTWIEITKRKSNGVVHGAFPMREQKPQKPEIAINTCI